MFEQSKRPIVYVERELGVYIKGNYRTFGFFVSKAYLKETTINYENDGSKFVVNKVDFNVNPVMFIEDKDFKICVESGTEVLRPKIFKDYKSCKEHVNKKNYIFATTVGTTSASKMAKRMELHKQVLKYGAELEEQYIPLEEREQTSENTNNH